MQKPNKNATEILRPCFFLGRLLLCFLRIIFDPEGNAFKSNHGAVGVFLYDPVTAKSRHQNCAKSCEKKMSKKMSDQSKI